ncbi:hypothetical protein CLV57_2383 [Mucilaginibacter auburnensis]|uniref:Uncharacterized protein n=1 Tax=Mucilaginibacter auburnensis TaxID=1457233 RepID=A0A2H9VLQ3_9SPHI|nr:hypothetical protein CLV57_2383 [Mucilaginibacter auburnensis]
MNNKAVSALLIGLNFLLLIAYLDQGFVTEDEGIRNIYLVIVYLFVTCLVTCIFYRQTRRTAFFWVTVVVSIAFVLATVFYLYFLALGHASWR